MTDPQASRSLRAIMGQAKRAHRILRDLMYVARPPEPRPRSCQPDEVVRACLRDLKPEAEARGVRLVEEPRDGGPPTRTWTDPDALRHLIETLLRNALEATPRGGDGHGLDRDRRRRAPRVHPGQRARGRRDSKGRTCSIPSSAADRRAAAWASASPGSPG